MPNTRRVVGISLSVLHFDLTGRTVCVMYDTPDEQHTHLCHDFQYNVINGVPVLDIPNNNE